jgi:hypothetical protein
MFINKNKYVFQNNKKNKWIKKGFVLNVYIFFPKSF